MATTTAISLFGYRLIEVELLNYNRSIVYSVEMYITTAGSTLDALANRGKTATPQEMTEIFEAMFGAYEYFDAFYLLDEDGKVTAAAPQSDRLLGIDMSRQPFYAAALAIPDIVISPPQISWRTGHPIVYLAQDISHRRVVVAELNLSSLQQAIASGQQTLRNTTVFVTDGKGNIIAHPDEALVFEQTRWDGLDAIQSAPEQNSMMLYNSQGSLDILIASDIRQIGWYVISTTPLSKFIHPYAVGILSFLILSTTIMAFLLRSFWRRFKRHVSDPLKQLSQLTHTIAQGEYLSLPLSQPIGEISVTFDELETLKTDLYRMNQSLRAREKALQETQNELQALNNQLEVRVVERTAQLEAATREMESFSYSVSHDLRAPLRHVNGYTQMLMDEYAGRFDERGRGLLERAHQASLRMADLIDALLMLSRVSRSEMRCTAINLSALTNEVANELQLLYPERVVEWRIQPGLTAYADTSLLRVVLNNLLHNAWKFTARCEHAVIEVGKANEDTPVVYFVRDNGAGFDMAYADKLFGAFQRLHSESEFEGTGIGLALVQRVIHRHGGEIWAEAVSGCGATFYFTLSGKA
ncbi:MAG: sensor histidine kinase [Chloroflexota bacterium]